jgi:uncharacterized Zn finger protein
MSLKFRLKGLAETFVDSITCPGCNYEAENEEDMSFKTDLSRVTYDGIVVVVRCQKCGHVFVPENQKHGIINGQRLRNAVDLDSQHTGIPVFPDMKSVKLDVEKMNLSKAEKIQ